jgi:hypothetical protein
MQFALCFDVVGSHVRFDGKFLATYQHIVKHIVAFIKHIVKHFEFLMLGAIKVKCSEVFHTSNFRIVRETYRSCPVYRARLSPDK